MKYAAVLMSSLFFIFVTACGGGQSTDPAAFERPSAAKPITLRISWWGSQTSNEATLEALEVYTKTHPNVTFEPEYTAYSGYWDKLNTAITAKEAPDLIQMDITVLNQFVSNRQLAELTDIHTEDIDPVLLNTGKVGGKLYAVPLGNDMNGFAYNKSLMAKLGITAPDNDWTWDEYFQYGRDIQSKLDKGMYALMDSTTNIEMYNMYQISQGKGYLIDNNGHFHLDRELFETFIAIHSQLRKEGVMPPPEVTITHSDLDRQNDLGVNGSVVVRQLYAAMYADLNHLSPGTFGMVSIPRALSKGGWVTPSSFWSVGANSTHAAEAQAFIDWFINSKEAGGFLKTMVGIPASGKILDYLSPSFSDADQVVLEFFKRSAANAPAYPITPAGWAGFTKDYGMTMEKVLFGVMKPEEAYNELVEKAKQYE